MSDISKPSGPQEDTEISNVLVVEPGERVPHETSQELPTDSVGGTENGNHLDPSTDGCIGEDEGPDATDPHVQPSSSSLLESSGEQMVQSAQHEEECIMAEPARPAEALKDKLMDSEFKGQFTDDPDSAERSTKAANCPTDDGSDDFGDFEDVEEGVAQSPDASDDADSDDGFGGFEEAAEGSTAVAPQVKDSAVVDSTAQPTSGSGTQQMVPDQQSAGSHHDIFISSKADFLEQVRQMLCPLKSVTTHDRGDGKDIDIVSLDILMDHLQSTHSPDGFGLSQLAKQASHIGAVEIHQKQVTPIMWEGSKAESRFLSRCPKSKLEPSARQPPDLKASQGSAGEQASGNQDAPAEVSGVAINIFTASGVVLDSHYMAGSSGTRVAPVGNGDHVEGAAMASGHGRQVSGAAELPSQSALDTSGFGAWATDPTLIPGMSLPLGTGLEASPSLTQAASGLESARDLSGRSQAASTTASSAWEHGGSAPLADSAALTHLEQGGSPRRSLNRGSSASPSRLARSSSMLETELAGQEQWKVETDPAADTDVPDLSFMLSDTLVLPK